METWLSRILEYGPVLRVRRNHGLEHATLHLLAQRFPQRPMAGYSDTGGFWLFGDVPTASVTSAVAEALERMRRGEDLLAVHPNCGTNFVTSGTLAGIGGALAMLGAGPKVRDKLERLSMAALVATLVLILSQPLGNLIQAKVTTSGQPGSMRVSKIVPGHRGKMTTHRVVTYG